LQIIKAEVTPVELRLRHPARMAGMPPVEQVVAFFVRIETRKGQSAWGCGVAHPQLTGEKPSEALRHCQAAADKATSLHPTNLEYSLAELYPLVGNSPAASCAFDLVFHDLLGLAADLPLYKLMGGYRNRIQTSITIPLEDLVESVEHAQQYASAGFRIFKIKGGLDPAEDVRRVKAIHSALPGLTLRLDADGGYDVQGALDVARALVDEIEILEQPTPATDLRGLREVTRLSPVPVLADQSVSTPASALDLASHHAVNGLAIKLASCGGLGCARQIDTIARTAHMFSMVSCTIEPALLIAAGLSLALSSPNIRYGDLDGHLDLINDPTVASAFRLEDGWLTAMDVSGLGCTVNL
jgi:L-Ala-D/L-Glu epimerase